MGVWEVRSVIESGMRDAGPGIESSITANGGTVPEIVVATCVAALIEALRNSSQHAPGSQRSVHTGLASEYVHIVVSEDGPGFQTDRIEPNRLGVSRSISARTMDLPGGSGDIASVPGESTVVTLKWRRS